MIIHIHVQLCNNEKKMELFIIYINIYNLNHLPLDKGFTFHSAELWDSVSSKLEGFLCRLRAIHKSGTGWGQYTNQVKAEGNTQIRTIHKSGRHHCYHSCNSEQPQIDLGGGCIEHSTDQTKGIVTYRTKHRCSAGGLFFYWRTKVVWP